MEGMLLALAAAGPGGERGGVEPAPCGIVGPEGQEQRH